MCLQKSKYVCTTTVIICTCYILPIIWLKTNTVKTIIAHVCKYGGKYMKALENIRAWRHLFCLPRCWWDTCCNLTDFSLSARDFFLQKKIEKNSSNHSARCTQKWKTIAAIIVYINIRMALLAWSFFSEELAPPVQPFMESFSFLFSPAPFFSVPPVTGFKSWLLFWSLLSTR